jgi:hypothetical protein
MVCKRLVVLVLVGALTSAGCTTLKPVRLASPGEPLFGNVKTGDTVIVQTRSGEQTQFVVQQIDGETLVASDGRRYARPDVVFLQRKALDGPKTAGLVAAISGAAFIAIVVSIGLWLTKNSQ